MKKTPETDALTKLFSSEKSDNTFWCAGEDLGTPARSLSATPKVHITSKHVSEHFLAISHRLISPRTLQASNKFDPERFSCELPQVVLTFRFKSSQPIKLKIPDTMSGIFSLVRGRGLAYVPQARNYIFQNKF